MSIPFTWLYLISDPFTGLTKIGQSDDPVKRLQELKRKPSTVLAAPSSEYEIVAAWLFATMEKLEAVYHKRFDSKRARGEWFDLTSFDVVTLQSENYDRPTLRRLAGMSGEFCTEYGIACPMSQRSIDLVYRTQPLSKPLDLSHVREAMNV